MTQEKRLNRYYGFLIFIMLFLYATTMLVKQVFIAETVELIDVFNTTATKISLCNLFYYTAYAISQAVLSIFIDKINIKYYVSITTGLSAIGYALIAIIGRNGGGITFLYISFTLIGILQAGVFGSCIKIFSMYLSEKMYILAVRILTIITIVSLIGAYLVCSYYVAIQRWDIPFIIFAVMLLIAVVLFFTLINRTAKKILSLGHVSDSKQDIDYSHQSKSFKKIEGGYFTFICAILLLCHLLHYSLNSWMPTILYDNFNLDKSYSILLSVSVSIAVGLSTNVGISLFKDSKSPFIKTSYFYIVSIVCAILLIFLYDKIMIVSLLLCLICLSTISIARGGYNSVNSYKVRHIVDPGKYSMIGNAAASIAAGSAPTLFSLLFENFGWSFAFGAFAVLIVLTFVIAVGCQIMQNKLFSAFEKEKSKNN